VASSISKEEIMKSLRHTLSLAGLLLACISLPAHAQRAHIGPHFGYNFDMDRAAIGGQMLLPLSENVELYPSFDYYLVNSGNQFGLSGDLKFRMPTGYGSAFYLGGGLNYQNASSGGVSNNDTGWDMLFGFESRRGVAHPYIEGRVLGHSNTSFQIGAGLNFTIF
jgi:hypothetical protein